MEPGNEAGSRVFGPPLLVALAACLLLAIGSVLAPEVLPRRELPVLLLAGAGAGLASGGLVLFAALRSGQWLVAIGALFALPAVGALAGYGAHRIYAARAAADAMTFAEMEIGPDGSPALPRGASGAGPISAAWQAALRDAEKDRMAYAAAFGGLNVGVLGSPYLLQQQPGILHRCADLTGLEGHARRVSDRHRARIAALSDRIGSSELSADVRQGARRIVEADALSALLEVELETIRATRAQCDLLARRTWHNAAGLFGFASAADRAAWATIAERRQRAAEMLKRLQTAATAQRTAGRDRVRETLSR